MGGQLKTNEVMPPRIARWMLLKFLREDLVEEVCGDLEEKFYATCKRKSIFKAKINFWYQTINYLRPFAIRKLSSTPSNHYDMYQSYFKIGWRNLLKNKGYSFINIGGLAVGMSVAMLIGLWIYDEVSYDKYHENYGRIGRVIRNGTVNGETFSTTYLPYALGEELKSKYGSNFKHVIKAWPISDHILSVAEKKITHGGQFIDAGAPEMLSLKMIDGSRAGLKDPHSILLSASLAKILFGDDDPMDKALKIDNEMDVKVTGVYEDLPNNTHFRGAGFFAPWDLFVSHNQWMVNQGFKNNFLDIYTEIQPGTDFEKVMGSVRTQLVNQFFSESFLVVSLAFIVSILFVSISLPWFNTLAGKQMSMFWTSPYFWSISFAFIMITGVLAGSYPALYLSAFQPVKVLKGVFRVGRFSTVPRKVLVVVQFTVSITLIAGTIIVFQQIQFAKNRPVGYTRNGLIMMQITSSDFNGKIDALRTELKSTGVVEEVAESASPATAIWSSNGGFSWEGKDPALRTEFATLSVAPEYGKTIGWQFLKGRDFSKDLASDSAGFIITESLAKILNFEDPIGEMVRWEPGWRKASTFEVIGVVKDMVMASPFENTMPTVFFIGRSSNWMNIRISKNVSVQEALPKIETAFKKIIPSVPFDYKFADQEYELKFAAEERIGKLASVFATLAILISCLGLFGLASFVAEQRTKEIGIRKVVGASVFNLWKLLSKDFIVLVVISCIISIPVAYYFLSDWLQKYDYKTEISWWVFSISAFGAISITLATVSYQAIRAALMSPVNSLRSGQ